MTRTIQTARRTIGFALIGVALLSSLVCASHVHAATGSVVSAGTSSDFAEYSESEPSPSGRIRVSRPVVAWKIVPGKETRVTGVVLRIDQEPVATTYSEAKQAVWYTPTEAFRSGRHTVQCAVQLNGEAWVDKSWEFVIEQGATATPTLPDKIQQDAATAINLFRKRAGLSPVTLDARLCAAAQEHTTYLSKHSSLVHEQDTASPDFLARDSSGRAQAFGYVGGCFEAIGQGSRDIAALANQLFDAPYHRGAFLQPGLVELGAGIRGDKATFVVGEGSATGTVTYPANNQGDVPLSWNGEEAPNPLRMHNRAPKSGPLGYAITLHTFGSGSMGETQLFGVKAELFTDKDSKPVVVYVNSPDNDDHLTNAVFLIPARPLKASTVYRAVVSAKDAAGNAVRREWRFTTAAK